MQFTIDSKSPLQFIRFTPSLDNKRVILPISVITCIKEVNPNLIRIFISEEEYFETELSIDKIIAKLTSLGIQVA